MRQVVQKHIQNNGNSSNGYSGLVIQRKCNCGSVASLNHRCDNCEKEKLIGVQAKLRIGAADSACEQEADRVSDQVMAMTTPLHIGNAPLRIQRLAGQATGQPDNTAPSNIEGVLAAAGAPLKPALRKDMGQRFGHDFSQVRIHTGSKAEQSARDINANAYTVGNNIVFAAGQFSPGTNSGKRLLAHELTHVVQQGENIIRRDMPKDPFGRPLGFFPTPEQEAYDKLTYELKEWERTLARLSKGELDDRDLANIRLRNRLTGLTAAEVNALISKIKNNKKLNPKLSVSKIIEWLEVRKEISTPMSDGATVAKDPITDQIESYSMTINKVKVKVVADSFGSSGNSTRPVTNFGSSYKWAANSKGIVSSLTNTEGGGNVSINPTTFEVTIQTSYANSPDAVSAYGRGTTERDKKEKTTSLRVHEGSHGTDYIQYVKETPFPVDISKGIVGVITVAQMKKIDAYIGSMTKQSCETTDQVGFSQDKFIKTDKGKKSGVTSCR